PAVADGPDALVVGDPHVGEEDLVELGLTRDLPQRPYLHARRGHVADEVGEALVLWYGWVGARQQDRPPRLMCQRGPHLLPVDHPGVAVAHGSGGETGEVRASAWLAEELAPHLLTGPEWTEVAAPLLVGAVGQDGRRRHAETDADPARIVVWRTRLGELGVDRGLQRPRQAEPAKPDRIVDPRQARVEAGPQELQPVHGDVVLGEELRHPATQVGGELVEPAA